MLRVSKSDFTREVSQDCCGDSSYLGEYSDAPATAWAVDRQERGDMERNSYRYWNPGENHTPPGNLVSWAHVPNTQVADAIRKYGNRRNAIRALDIGYIEQDYQRMEALNRGDWHFVSVRAVVNVILDIDGTQGVIQCFKSPGLHGIESDCGEEYLNEVFNEECETLAEMLQSLGTEVTI